MARPRLLIGASQEPFASFCAALEHGRLNRMFSRERLGGRNTSANFQPHLNKAEAMITIWDSLRFHDKLQIPAPRVRIIARCWAEVKSRFAQPLFERLSTNAAGPMARATAEMGRALLLYFEWEKKERLELADTGVALLPSANWFRKNYS